MIEFGTGGWRAIIGDGFTRENVERLSYALAQLMQEEKVLEKGMVIGYDRRFLSEQAAKWAAGVLAAMSVPVYMIDHDAPTPLIMFSVGHMQAPYGMMITASHNPAIYNGVKVFTSGGKDAGEDITQRIEAFEQALDIPSLPAPIAYDVALQEQRIQEIDPQNDYIDSILNALDLSAIRARNLKVVLDPMYGVSRTSLQSILFTARCNVDVIHERHDTLFGGRLPTPNVDTLEPLKRYVLEHKCDIGLATDGDADRLGVIDESGRFLHPNEILVLLYYYLLKDKGWKGPAVRNIATTHMLDRVATAFGEQCHEVPVGFKHISAKMLETNAVIGGESSGGLTVRGHILGKDGIYAASLLVEMMAVMGRHLSEIYSEIEQELGVLKSVERDYFLGAEKERKVREQLLTQRQLPHFPLPIERMSYEDGCKIYFPNDQWMCARFSGTEPLLRIFSQGESRAMAERLCDCTADFLAID